MRSERLSSAVAVAAALLLAAGCSKSDDAAKPPGSATQTNNPVVTMKTNKGTITLELFPDKAPKSVENFVAYADAGFYDGTIFHRVISDFMIQGGGYTAGLDRKETRPPVPNEANNGLKNELGTIAMARTSDPNSATSQFFVNVKNNAFLDFKSETPQGWGYTVFGKVIDGIDVVHAIEHTPTSDRGGAFANLPTDQVVIESVTVKKPS
jgi:cyclophilin family peptidyl-prolyl cis-trans isomerase